ncbi:UNVERIFIED_CONTAM: hypothetical protein HDU68_000228 [Siphonaria sp. JEL0065]|nr:hypothetical protein HDU68_000228 [Siphonaria sp. JEL0065]
MYGQSYTRAVVDNLVGTSQWTVFSQTLYSGPHAAVHNGVGGDFSFPPAAGNDPLFYIHHAMIDKIWSDWQINNPSQASIYSGNRDPSSPNAMNAQLTDYLAGSGGHMMKETLIERDTVTQQKSIKELEPKASEAKERATSNKAGVNLDTTILFKNELIETLKEHYNQIREECSSLENGMKVKQSEVIKKKELAFQLSNCESEIIQLKGHQSAEIARAKSCFETFMASKANSRKYKALNRSFLLQAKLRDLKIIQQESIAALASRMEQILLENRLEFADTVAHVEEIHTKKCKNLTDQQESHNRTEKAVYDLEISHLDEDLRAVMVKRYLVTQNHKKILDKKKFDQLKELQARELKHIKELFDFKLISTDNVFHLKQKHQEEIQAIDIKHYKERKEHEEVLTNLKENFQLRQLEEYHQNGLKALADSHRNTLNIKHNIHSQRLTAVQQATADSTIQRVYLSIYKWGESVSEGMAYEYGIDLKNSENADIKAGMAQIIAAEDNLISLKEKQITIRKNMLEGHIGQIKQLQESQQQEMIELKLIQETEILQLKKQHHSEITELKSVHDREVAMEHSIHDAECEALTERRILSSVLDSVIDGIIIIDTNAIIRRLNSAVEKIFDYKAEEIVGKNINMLMPHELAKRHDEIISNYLKTGKRNVIGIGRKLLGKRKNGQLFNIHLSVTEVKQEGVHLFTGVIRDITNESLQEEMAQEQRKRDEELQTITLAAEKKRADEAEQSRKQQERYIDMICHEIRNPLNGIQNNNELLSELLKDISGHLKENLVLDEKIDKILNASVNAVSAISHCAKHQKSIADDVLNMSKLSMSLIRISNTTPIDPISLTNTIFDTFHVEAKKKNLDLVLSIKPGLDALMQDYQISSDPARLSQILINLIANSIKFTEKQPTRRITVDIDALEFFEDGDSVATQMLKFGVSDTGIGMTEPEQALLFQQFSQASYKAHILRFYSFHRSINE